MWSAGRKVIRLGHVRWFGQEGIPVMEWRPYNGRSGTNVNNSLQEKYLKKCLLSLGREGVSTCVLCDVAGLDQNAQPYDQLVSRCGHRQIANILLELSEHDFQIVAGSQLYTATYCGVVAQPC
jgi:hypothetical protein